VMHGWNQTASAIYDSHALARFTNGVYFVVSGATGDFTNGEALTGDLGGAGLVNIGIADQVVPRSITTPFQVGEVLTGGSSGETATIASIETAQAFVVFPEMRGRNGSSGTADGGGRETQDIIDAVEHCRTTYSAVVDPDLVLIAGYSGGGGNVQSATARFPDYFAGAAAFFGMCDYGYTDGESWYYLNPAYSTGIAAWVGGVPSVVPKAYRARASVLARANYSGGHLWLYHDIDDIRVDAAMHVRAVYEMGAAGLSNFSESLTTSADAVRWLHESPTSGNPVVLAELDYLPDFCAGTLAAWTIPAAGALVVCGWVDTKRLSVWLGNGLATYGLCTYNTTTDTYTITTDTPTAISYLALKGRTPAATINATINGVADSEVADGDGVATFQIPFTAAPVPVVGGAGKGQRVGRVSRVPEAVL